jgi:hypothetical protein
MRWAYHENDAAHADAADLAFELRVRGLHDELVALAAKESPRYAHARQLRRLVELGVHHLF